MIIGIGTDIVSMERIKNIRGEKEGKFCERILTTKEHETYKGKSEGEKIPFLAKRFAAKEAISKALGTGIGKDLSFTDIEIYNNEKGKPLVIIKSMPQINIHLSLSDEKEGHAIAFALAEKKG